MEYFFYNLNWRDKMDEYLRELYRTSKSEEDFIKQFDVYTQMKNTIYYCIFCGKNRVRPEEGCDTYGK